MSRTTYKSESKIRTVVAVGVFCALAYVACVLFHFRAAFLTFDLKDAVMTIGAMLFGPLYGLAMTLIVALLEMLTVSTTGLYGFVMNVLASAAFVCVASLIYMHWRTMTGALVGTVCAVFAMTAVMLAANLIITPFYMGVTVDAVAGMIPTLLLPFNLTKAIFNASLVFILYKPISSALARAGFASVTHTADKDASKPVPSQEKKVVYSPVVIAAAVLAVASLAYFFVSLHGSFTFAEFAQKEDEETTSDEAEEAEPEASDSARIAESLIFTI